MNELVQQVSQRVGIPEDKARQATETVLSFLRTRLPAPVSSQIDSFLQSGATQNVAGKVSDFLGKTGS
jgi:uncharacterized protein (DUF2267 family)